MRINRLKAELERAKQKAVEWQVRVKDLERQITEQENLEIVQAVRSVTTTPEELKKILEIIQSMKTLPQDSFIKKEGADENEK